MKQNSRSHIRLADRTVEGAFAVAPSATERRGDLIIRESGIQEAEDGAKEASEGLGHEECHAAAERGEYIAMGSRPARNESFELTAVDGSVEDLGETDLKLQDGVW
jgi:hypothetical protein